MKFYVVIMCVLVIFYGIQSAPRHLRKRREITEKKVDGNVKDKHNSERSGDNKKHKSDSGQQQHKKKQYVPIVPAYDTDNMIREDNRPVQVVRIRDLSISNGVIERSNIVQI